MKPGAWRVASACVVGAAHVGQKTECQDRFACRTLVTAADGEVLIAAVADGAGSTSLGGRGAEIACELFAGAVADFLSLPAASVGSLSKDFGVGWIDFFRRKIGDVAQAESAAVREYASTLVGAVVGARRAAFFQVGDGAAVFSAAGGDYRFAVAPAESLYVNMTDFLTDDAAAENLRFEVVKGPVENLILFSDGIFPVAVNFQTNEPHAPFLAPMIAPLRDGAGGRPEALSAKLAEYLASPKMGEKSDDDKTIILAARHSPEAATAAENGERQSAGREAV